MSTSADAVNDLHELAQRAAQRWTELRSLNMSANGEEGELRAAGVSERRIALLLAPRFDELVPALLERVQQADFKPSGTAEVWKNTSEESSSLFWQIFGNSRNRELDAFWISGGGNRLRDFIFGCLDEDLRASRSSHMVASLWRMHNLMALPQHACKELVQRCFLEASSWVPLPTRD